MLVKPITDQRIVVTPGHHGEMLGLNGTPIEAFGMGERNDRVVGPMCNEEGHADSSDSFARQIPVPQQLADRQKRIALRCNIDDRSIRVLRG